MDLATQLETIIQPILDAENVELVELELKGREGSQILKVFIDGEAGVTLDKCSVVSRLISDHLDIEDLISGKYTLQVSSPGITRPLRTARDFRRNLNKEVEILIDEEKPAWFCGIVIDVSDSTIAIKGKKETRDIPISRIKHGKLNPPW